MGHSDQPDAFEYHSPFRPCRTYGPAEIRIEAAISGKVPSMRSSMLKTLTRARMASTLVVIE